MSIWTETELALAARVDELRISSVRADGTATRPITVWAVRVGDRIYMRSVHGRDAGWFKATRATGTGHISIGGLEHDVTFTEITDPAELEAISQAYKVKYGRYAKNIVASTFAPDAVAATIAADPR
jgi:hypothetical protein